MATATISSLFYVLPLPTLQVKMSSEYKAPFRHLHFLSLNRDVLQSISEFCSPTDSLQLAKTCRDAYHFAMPRVLSEVSLGRADPAVSNGPEQVTQFCSYMLAEPHDRMRYLKVLEMHEGAFASALRVGGREGWKSDFSCAPILAELLRQASNLRVIFIRDLELLLKSQPTIGDALAALPSLREISFYYIGCSTLEMLERFASTPARIECGMWKDGPRHPGDVTPFGPFAESLQSLKLSECGCLLESVIDGYVWPHLTALRIGGRIARFSQLARAFPNLRRLAFDHEFSVAAETGPAVVWPEIDCLEASAPLPTFPCPVRRLQLCYTIGSHGSMQTSVDLKTLLLLERTSPAVLSCTVMAGTPKTTLERIAASAPKLKYLELVVSHPLHDQWITWMETNMPVFNSAPLIGIYLSYSSLVSSLRPSEAQQQRLLKFARSLIAQIPTLRFLGVSVPNSPDRYWYRVQPCQAGSAPPLERLSVAEGKRVRAQLLQMPR
ncbi:hypothetical protein A0H81_02134 [Grifola frondosa]|uniref:F-box domain-containing protein n=1 Tax=Grifola frondosa TaxID=5627 RepID=A0A1C7MM15_GRIFR|nr:hypothetical protein A0H81_02134 [Grifola frondosa]